MLILQLGVRQQLLLIVIVVVLACFVVGAERVISDGAQVFGETRLGEAKGICTTQHSANSTGVRLVTITKAQEVVVVHSLHCGEGSLDDFLLANGMPLVLHARLLKQVEGRLVQVAELPDENASLDAHTIKEMVRLML